MRQHGYIGSFAIVMALFLAPVRASAQAMLADDIVILSKGQREQEKSRTNSHLGSTPGAGERLFRQNPGGGEPRLGEQRAEGRFGRACKLETSSPPQAPKEGPSDRARDKQESYRQRYIRPRPCRSTDSRSARGLRRRAT